MNRITRSIAVALIALGLLAGVSTPTYAGSSTRGGVSFVGGP